MINAVLFDLDDTLLDRNATAGRFLRAQHARLVAPVCPVPVDPFVGKVLAYQEHGYGDKPDAYRRACVETDISGVAPDTLLDDFNKNYGDTPVLLPGARETLEILRERYVLGIVTNSRTAWQHAKLDAAGLRGYFKEVVVSEAVRVSKPDPGIFKLCLDRLGLGPDECVYVGDHPEKDIDGAHAAGMRAVWVRNAFYPPPARPDGSIGTLSELPGLVASM